MTTLTDDLRRSSRTTNWVALGAAVVALVALPLPSGDVKLALLVLFSMVGPGAALVAHLKIAETWAISALVVTASLTISAVIPAVMIWTEWWQPVPALLVVVVATAVSAAVSLIQDRKARS